MNSRLICLIYSNILLQVIFFYEIRLFRSYLKGFQQYQQWWCEYWMQSMQQAITIMHSAHSSVLVKLSVQLSCSTAVPPSANNLIDGNIIFNCRNYVLQSATFDLFPQHTAHHSIFHFYLPWKNLQTIFLSTCGSQNGAPRFQLYNVLAYIHTYMCVCLHASVVVIKNFVPR